MVLVNYARSIKLLEIWRGSARIIGDPLWSECRLLFSRGHLLGDDRTLLAHDLARAGEVGEAGESLQVLQCAVRHDVQRVTEHLPVCLGPWCTAARNNEFPKLKTDPNILS